MRRVAILASGTGSNAQAIIECFKNDQEVEVVVVGSNRKAAQALEKATVEGVDTFHFSKKEMNNGVLLAELTSRNVEWILLSGFLLKIPSEIIDKFNGRMLNIHPSLLPKFGGEGMYGMNVHKAVFEAGETESGMTIHQVSEQYDEGGIVFQVSVDISLAESAEEIASKVLALEHEYYPRVALAWIKDYDYAVQC